MHIEDELARPRPMENLLPLVAQPDCGLDGFL
jgi:hypothetical protein